MSLADLWNSGAVEVGETLARLLYHGFGVGVAIEIVREHTSLGNQYIVLGDPGVAFAQCESYTPVIHHVHELNNSSDDPDQITVEAFAYVTRISGIGSIACPYLLECEQYYIATGRCGVTTTDKITLFQHLEGERAPLIVEDELSWIDTYLAGNDT